MSESDVPIGSRWKTITGAIIRACGPCPDVHSEPTIRVEYEDTGHAACFRPHWFARDCRRLDTPADVPVVGQWYWCKDGMMAGKLMQYTGTTVRDEHKLYDEHYTLVWTGSIESFRSNFEPASPPSPAVKVGDVVRDPGLLRAGMRVTLDWITDRPETVLGERFSNYWAGHNGWWAGHNGWIVRDSCVAEEGGVTILALPGEPEAPPAPSPKSEPGHDFSDRYCFYRGQRVCKRCGVRNAFPFSSTDCEEIPNWRANLDEQIADDMTTNDLTADSTNPPLTGPPEPSPHGFGALAGRYRYSR